MYTTLERPLSHVATDLCGDVDVSHIDGEFTRLFLKAAVKWTRLSSHVETKIAHDASKLDLSYDQEHSFRVLHDFFSGRYQDSETDLQHCPGFECFRFQEYEDSEPLQKQVKEFVIAHSIEGFFNDCLDWRSDWSLHRHRQDGRSYNLCMNLLFFVEFINGDGLDLSVVLFDQPEEIISTWKTLTDSVSLSYWRKEARVRAWTQEASLNAFIEVARHHRDIPKHLRDSFTQWVDGDHASQKQRTTPEISFLHWDAAAGPQQQPHKWLRHTDKGTTRGMPYFLWDRERRTTVRSLDLKSTTEYCAISHTWGRWRKLNNEGKHSPPVVVEGVPWRVPENARFSVTDLGSKLDLLSLQCRYVWVDLLCIPQETDEHTEAIKNSEIARQAEIFQNAKYAVAWLNDVPNFRCLSLLLQYMAFYPLLYERSAAANTLKHAICGSLLETMGDRPSYLVDPNTDLEGIPRMYDGSVVDFNEIHNSWFTSLWTLQELVLRPNMFLCGADWDLVSLNGTDPLPLNGLVAIFDTYHEDVHTPLRQTRGACKQWTMHFVTTVLKNHGSKYEKTVSRAHHALDAVDSASKGIAHTLRKQIGWGSRIWSKAETSLHHHRAYREVVAWLQGTGLETLHSLQKVEILTLGDKRQCRYRRAEATMSALGATKWYHGFPREHHEQNLVLGKFPLPFVQEIMQADAGSFFAGFVSGNNFFGFDKSGFHKLPEQNQDVAHGTMLPFSKDRAIYYPIPEIEGLVTHPAVPSWEVRLDGSVTIPRACLLLSSTRTWSDSRKILPASLSGFRTDRVPRIDGTTVTSMEKRIIDGTGAHHVYKCNWWVDLEAWIHTRFRFDYGEVHAVVVRTRQAKELRPFGNFEEITRIDGILIASLKREPQKLAKLGYFNVRYEGIYQMPAEEVVNWTIV